MAGYIRTLARAVTGRKMFDADSFAALVGYGNTGDLPPRVQATYASLVEWGYKRNVAVFRAIADIANSCASVRLDVFVGGQRVEPGAKGVTGALLALLKRPNPRQSWPTLMELAVTYYKLSGSAYLLAIGADTKAPPQFVRTLRPDLVRLHLDASASKVGAVRYEYRPRGVGEPKNYVVRDDDVSPELLHVKTVNPGDELEGFSPLVPAMTPIDRHNLSDEFGVNLLRNGAQPSGALFVERAGDNTASLTDSERTAIKAELAENVSGPGNAGKPLVLEGGLRWQQMSLTPLDMDWSTGKASAMRDAVNALGYPPMLLGIPGDNTFSNQREARQALWEQEVIPLLTKLCAELSAWLGAHFGLDLDIRPNVDGVPALAPKRERVLESVKGAWWLTTNEARRVTGWEPIDDPSADKVLVTVQQVPLDLAVAPPELEPVEDEPEGTPEPVAELPAAKPEEPDAAVASQLALNGAQVASLLAVLAAVATGALPKPSAIVLIMTSFAMSDANARAMVDPIAVNPPQDPAPDPDEDEADPDAEPDEDEDEGAEA